MAVTCCDCALGTLSELAEGQVVASQQNTGSTPAVVPGAAPALAKAGVGGYGRHESHYYGLDLTKIASTGCSGCDRQAANHPKGRPSADDQCGRNESERLKCSNVQ